jgi:hypothetical protein
LEAKENISPLHSGYKELVKMCTTKINDEPSENVKTIRKCGCYELTSRLYRQPLTGVTALSYHTIVFCFSNVTPENLRVRFYSDPASVHSIVHVSLIYHSFIAPDNVIRVKYHTRVVY